MNKTRNNSEIKDARIKKILSLLEGENYELILPDNQVSVNWLEKNFPIASWGRIDWQNVAFHKCFNWNDENEASDIFEKICSKYKLSDVSVVISWSNALSPEIKVSINAIKNHISSVFEADFDTWIICPSNGWVIENYHEGEICFGMLQDSQ